MYYSKEMKENLVYEFVQIFQYVLRMWQYRRRLYVILYPELGASGTRSSTLGSSYKYTILSLEDCYHFVAATSSLARSSFQEF